MGTTMMSDMTTLKTEFYKTDEWLNPFEVIIEGRINKCRCKEVELIQQAGLAKFAMGHFYYGLHFENRNWVFREYAPGASEIYLTGSFTGWEEKDEFKLHRVNASGDWEITLHGNTLKHLDLYKLSVHWNGGNGERIPSYANRVIQDDKTKIFSTQVWFPEIEYHWLTDNFVPSPNAPVIYEAHIGMATEDEKTGTYREFTDNIIPEIALLGYNTIQLMAIQEHPFYGSFGYHVSNFFAASSRFGTPDDLKGLIDTAHRYGLRVIMDLIHSHSVKNVNEGLALFDGSPDLYFHNGERRIHRAWDSLCFDYGKNKVIHFLLSNCRYWLEEYRFDGFRFDGITSMIYYDHGLEKDFTSYNDYFNGNQDEDALIYLYLANKLIHSFNPKAITIAEEMSGMPGMAASIERKGYGFDYRLAMGVPDYWIKLVKDSIDEDWNMGQLMHELIQHRPEEKIISYCESHDQALVGDKTLIFRMLDAEMYYSMSKTTQSLKVDRGVALHKMIRLLTFATSAGGYLNFMGNEFGHPEWIDFPRDGNNWSYKYARRQWSLSKNEDLKYHLLYNFDKAMLGLSKQFNIPGALPVERLFENNSDKTIVFTRGELLFVFNFNPVSSFTDYGIALKGKFKIILDTDDPLFGGFNRIDRDNLYYSIKKTEKYTNNAPFRLYLYLPARSAQVYIKLPVKGKSDL
jgi:1,4-alpha-glucan branching enzyme